MASEYSPTAAQLQSSIDDRAVARHISETTLFDASATSYICIRGPVEVVSTRAMLRETWRRLTSRARGSLGEGERPAASSLDVRLFLASWLSPRPLPPLPRDLRRYRAVPSSAATLFPLEMPLSLLLDQTAGHKRGQAQTSETMDQRCLVPGGCPVS